MLKTKIKILILDDEKKTAFLLSEFFSEHGLNNQFSTKPDEALGLLDGSYDILITDLQMPGKNGIEVLEEAQLLNPGIKSILMTAFASVETAVDAMKKGASDYIIKPFDENDLLEKVLTLVDIDETKKSILSNNAIIGNSKAIRQLRSQIAKVSRSDATVLITGESGTGKELVARNIHELSSRRANQFIDINCAAIAENLLESELFGYEKGAFTGADKRKPGLFELANGGSIFLDEIGEMPLTLQAKLLRVIQQKRVHRLGSIKNVEIDVRIIAATNRNLKEMTLNKLFREDLFFRLNVFPIETPALRNHLDDLEILLVHFLENHKYNRQIDEELISFLKNYDWPGNVRELQNKIERALILAEDRDLSIDDFSLSENQKTQNPQKTFASDDTLEIVEKKMLIDALDKSNGNKTKAAEILGITRRMVYSRMKKFDLK